MGQKTHPLGMRLGIIKDWDARWYAEKDYAALVQEDLMIRKTIKKRSYLMSGFIKERTKYWNAAFTS